MRIRTEIFKGLRIAENGKVVKWEARMQKQGQ